MQVQVNLNNRPAVAVAEFAKQEDLKFVHGWRTSIGGDQNPIRVDAVDIAHVAVCRFEAHSPFEQYAGSMSDIGDFIQRDEHAEVACFVLVKCDWFPESPIIGAVHFRRTWKNNLFLDYLSVHPYVARVPEGFTCNVRGAGTALLYFLGMVASRYGCGVIWGEATKGSCGFYKKAFDLEDVGDLIFVPREKILAFLDRLVAGEDSTNIAAARARDEIFEAEVESPPLLGNKSDVISPPRRLTYRLMTLPSHIQNEIADTLGHPLRRDSVPQAQEQLRIFVREIAASGRLSELWRLVESNHSDGEPDNNPFEML